MELKKQVDVCVVGAGHAGCEAALACARLGLQTVIFTVSVDSIALMPWNTCLTQCLYIPLNRPHRYFKMLCQL